MEVDKRFLTVLTPEGEFLRARNDSPYYQLGQEITFIPVTQVEKKKAAFLTLFQGRFLLPSAAALMLALFFFISFYQNNQVYAYLSIDINPSIELGINKKYEVIELESYNADGEKVINQIQDWKHKELDDVVEHLVGEIKKQGYMKNKQKMVVATVYAKEEHPEKDKPLKQEMKQITELVTAENLELTVVEGTKTEREKAMIEGLTTGLYKEKQLKEHKAKSESEKKVKQAKDKVNSVLVEEQTNNPIETVPSVQEEKVKNVKEKNSNIPPGQIKKAEKQTKKDEKRTKKEEKWIKKDEKQRDKVNAPVDVNQKESAAIPPTQETPRNQKQINNEAKKQEQKIQEQKNWESLKQQDNNRENNRGQQNNQNGNNAGQENKSNKQSDMKPGESKGNYPHANNGRGNNKDEK